MRSKCFSRKGIRLLRRARLAIEHIQWENISCLPVQSPSLACAVRSSEGDMPVVAFSQVVQLRQSPAPPSHKARQLSRAQAPQTSCVRRSHWVPLMIRRIERLCQADGKMVAQDARNLETAQAYREMVVRHQIQTIMAACTYLGQSFN